MPEKKISILEVIPFHSEKITTSRKGELVVLTYPRFRSRFAQRWLTSKYFPSHITIRLEQHGSAVWELIDGKRTVSEIITLLADHFKEDPHYGVRVIQYIFQLHKDKLIDYQVE